MTYGKRRVPLLSSRSRRATQKEQAAALRKCRSFQIITRIFTQIFILHFKVTLWFFPSLWIFELEFVSMHGLPSSPVVCAGWPGKV